MKQPIKRIKEPSEKLLEYYEKYYHRNQNKWMRRSKLEDKHLFIDFEMGKVNYKLLGSVSENEVLIKDLDNECFYISHIDDVTKSIL